jgi:hypothetical protein
MNIADICDVCDLPAAPHKPEECLDELKRKKKIADDMFDAAISLLVKMGEPLEIADEKIRDAVVALDVETWRYAV